MDSGATCILRVDGSRDSAIHTKYRKANPIPVVARLRRGENLITSKVLEAD